MFKNRRNNIRNRKVDNDFEDDAGDAKGDEGDDDGSKNMLRGTGAAAQHQRRKDGSSKGAAPSLLSFDDGEAEEAEVFQVKKKPAALGSHHGVKKKSIRAPDASRQPEDEGEGAAGLVRENPSYSAANLRDLIGAQKGFAARPLEHVDNTVTAPVELKLRGTLKPAGADEAPHHAPHARDPILEVRPTPPPFV